MSTRLSIDVSSLPGWSSVTGGSHTLTIVAKATGYLDSEPSAGVTITKVVNYTITATATNATCTPFVATVTSGGSQTFSASADGTSYKLPTSITVAGTTVNAGSSQTITGKCTVLYTRTSDTSGSIAFSNVTDNVSFSVVGEAARITDLTGTMWKFENQITWTGEETLYNIIGTATSAEHGNQNGSYISLSSAPRIYFFVDSSGTYQYPGYRQLYGTNAYRFGLSDSWQEVNSITLSITGGTDVTNATLIDWLYSNATRTS